MSVDKRKKIKILAVDDEQSVLDAYQKILRPLDSSAGEQKSALESKLFGGKGIDDTRDPFSFELVCRKQGDQALEAIRQAKVTNDPFAVIFLDVRMPPGPDGIWTGEQIRKIDQDCNIILVTAYSDVTPEEVAVRIPPMDKILYLQKPFHTSEIKQFAAALANKWRAERGIKALNENLEKRVEERTRELHLVNEALNEEITKHKLTEKRLRETQHQLESKARDLEGTNIALTQLFRKHEKDKKDLEQQVLFSVNEMIIPYLDTLKNSGLDKKQVAFVKTIEHHLGEIAAPFMRKLSYKYFRLTPIEIHVANLIKNNHSTKEIARLLDISKRTVEFHRDKIREKIGIKNTSSNLKAVLKKLDVEFAGD